MPAIPKLPDSQHAIIRLWVLGGVDAVPRHSTRSVECLIRNGYLGHNGPTDKAKDYVRQHEIGS